MKWFHNLRIKPKLIMGFLIVAMIGMIISIVGIINITKITNADRQLYEKVTNPLGEIGNVASAFQESSVNLRDLILDKRIEKREQYENNMKALDDTIENNLNQFEKSVTTDEDRQSFDGLKIDLGSYHGVRDRVIDLVHANQDDQAVAVLQTVGGEIAHANRVIEKLVGSKESLAKETANINTQIANQSVMLTLILTICGFATSLLIGFLIANLISKPLLRGVTMIQEMSKGHLNQRLRLESRDEVGVLTRAMNDFADDLQMKVIGAMHNIAAGNIALEIQAQDEQDEITPALQKISESLQGLVMECKDLTQAAIDGKLEVRGSVEKYQGAYREIIEGVNSTLDALIGPLHVAAEYVDRISKGDIPPPITDTYYGDFNGVKNNLNQCIVAVNSLITDANNLAQVTVEGKLDARADANKHQGDFGRIIEGVNATLDAVIEPVYEATAVLQEMAKGNLQVSVKGNYQGDHALIKDALNFSLTTIQGYIGEISNSLTEMAGGNLDVEITRDYLGDFSEIKDSLNLIIKSFNEVLAELNSAADQVASGARNLADSSQALSQGSSEQASTVEEISASIEQIASQTKWNAEHASQASELSRAATEKAVGGNEQMKEMLKAMDEINDSSANISKIIKVIDEIAFQTNILALNAAVEAARAGQYGKGFAVVAEEVRNLAARSANAAKETTAMIEGSMMKVEIGTKIANNTAQALSQIVSGVNNATNLVAQIATASNEQATGIAQINQGITQVTQVTQNNTATTEESAAAAEELSGQAEMLKGLVMRFKTKTDLSRKAEMTPIAPKHNRGGNGMAQVAAASEGKLKKVKIALEDREFAKY